MYLGSDGVVRLASASCGKLLLTTPAVEAADTVFIAHVTVDDGSVVACPQASRTRESCKQTCDQLGGRKCFIREHQVIVGTPDPAHFDMFHSSSGTVTRSCVVWHDATLTVAVQDLPAGTRLNSVVMTNNKLHFYFENDVCAAVVAA
jgi:hypothetical protein